MKMKWEVEREAKEKACQDAAETLAKLVVHD